MTSSDDPTRPTPLPGEGSMPGQPGDAVQPGDTAAYPQPGWGGAAQPPVYGQPYAPPHPPPYPPGYGGSGPLPPPHPSATTALVLGLIGLIGGVMCGLPLVVSPFAWAIGARAKREIDASGGQMGGRDSAMAGYVLGIIGTVLMVLGILAIIAVIALAFAANPEPYTTYPETTY